MNRARPQLRWTSAGATDRGQVRQVNEDAYLDRPDIGLWAVADGMGGHAAGDLASRLVVQALGRSRQHGFLGRSVANLRRCLGDVNRRLYAEAQHRGVPVIGTTVAALLAARGHCVLLWVGDSRIYRMRRGVLHRLSHDHSQVQDLVDRGLLDRKFAETHPAGNIITRAVGADDRLQIDGRICEIKSGDRFLLCTDGLTKELPEGEIAEVLEQTDLNALPQALVNEACRRRGARDNVTVVAVHFLSQDASAVRR